MSDGATISLPFGTFSNSFYSSELLLWETLMAGSFRRLSLWEADEGHLLVFVLFIAMEHVTPKRRGSETTHACLLTLLR